MIRRYGLLLAAVLSLLAVIVVVVALEYKPAKLTPALRLQQAKSEVLQIHNEISVKGQYSEIWPENSHHAERAQLAQLELKLNAAQWLLERYRKL